MTAPLRIRELRIHRLAIPMRLRFKHAAAVREVADPIVVAITAGAPHAHRVGYGETLARSYVTGETPESVVEDIANVFTGRLASFRADKFVEALEVIEALPLQISGRVLTAARTAVELALLDLACKVFRRRPADVAGWLGLPGFGAPGCRENARYSGIITGSTRARIRRAVRLQRWYGLRDFKLKVAVDGWEQRLAWTYEALRGALERNRATLRVDANGGWSLAEANEAVGTLEQFGVSALEQPLPESLDADLPYLAEQTVCDLIADESLLTPDDGQRLLDQGGVRVFNIRLAKNGGLLPSLRLARMVLAAGRDVQLGCLVGETSILSAAGIAFLEACPRVRFVEGAYGRYLLHDDVTARPVRFGFRGRMGPRTGHGLGVRVDPDRLARLAAESPRTLPL